MQTRKSGGEPTPGRRRVQSSGAADENRQFHVAVRHLDTVKFFFPYDESFPRREPRPASLPAGLCIAAPISAEFAQILTPEALAFVAKLHRQFESRRQELLARRAARQKEFDAGALPDFLPETKKIRDCGLADRAAAEGHARPARRDHRPDRPQDGDQRAQLRRLHLHGGLRGRQLPDLVQHDRRPDQPARRGAPHDHARAGRQELQAERQDRGADAAPARLAPRREARARSTASRSPAASSTSRCYFFHNAKELLARGSGPVLLPAEDGIAPRGAAVERRFSSFAQDDLGLPQGTIKATVPDRDRARGVRDGRDPLGAARALGRPQHRPLGLHLLLHQEIPRQQGFLPRRPRAGDDDRALHARLRAAAGEDLPPARRAGDGRHGGADPDQERPGRERGGAREGAPGQAARSDRRLRRHLGRAPGRWCRSRRKCSTSTCRSRTSTASSAPT